VEALSRGKERSIKDIGISGYRGRGFRVSGYQREEYQGYQGIKDKIPDVQIYWSLSPIT
jgi:hypothetical protein